MKFLVYSDFHGLFGMINHFKKVKLDIKSYKPDFIIFCGDFRNKISKTLLNVRVKNLRLPVYYVWGNDDEVKPEFELRNGKNIHLKLVNFDENLSLAGIGGDEYDVEWNIQKFDEILSNNFKDLIIISHVPPYSACDLANDGRNVGSKELLDLILKYKPRLSLFGHIHENWGESKCFKEVEFINIGPKGFFIEYRYGSFIIENLEDI